MAIVLNLHLEAEQLIVDFDDQHDSVQTSLAALPPIERLQANPFTHGKTLTDALGGEKYLLARLQNDPDNLILLNCDDAADSFAWEFATCADGQFLCIKAGMLRTVERDAPPITGDGQINFVALMADPLVDQNGNLFLVKDSDGNLKEDNRRLDLDKEMNAIRTTLKNCGKSLEARRIAPIREELYKALRKGPAILHLSCHGNVVPTGIGPMAVLSLEKNDGSHDPFAGSDLMNTKRGILRMILLSACKTAIGTEANLARALALNGVPMTVGMQESIDDTLSDEIATALYDSLFAGFTFGEALQQARQNISQRTESVGLLVGYVARNGWKETLPLRDGPPLVGSLGKPGIASLGGEIQPPRPLLGRNSELHQLAKLFAGGQKVITVAGTGGMGKTALAAAFAERFAWLWSQGVRAHSFANEVNFASFIAALLRTLYGNETAIQMAALPDNEKRQAVLNGAREWDGLWLFDNYESIMQGLLEANIEAERIHHLIGDLANGGAVLLLTSREKPAGLKNEILFPEDERLHGLRNSAGMELFFQHSTKAKKNKKEHVELALQIQQAAEGHPLAIALLAGEYDTSAVSQANFLKNWQDELTSARRDSQMGHQVTFTTAFERSYSHLPPNLKLALTSLSIFPFPFFVEGFAVVTGGLPLDDEQLSEDQEQQDHGLSSLIRISLSNAKQTLDELTRSSLLEVDGWFDDGSPATYRFQPALRQEAARRVDGSQKEIQHKGYAAYGAWLAKRGYADIQSDIALNRVVRLSMDALEKATDELQGVERLWHIRHLAWLKNAWGEVGEAFGLLNFAVSESMPDPKSEPEIADVQSAIRFTLADVYVTRGDLDRALQLYQESLQIKEQLGDKQGKAATLHQMAEVFLTRGDHDRALQLYQESLQIKEQLGDKKGAASTKRWLAVIASEHGDLDNALSLYEETLITAKELRDIDGQISSLHQMAGVFLTRGDHDRALQLYQESLQLMEQIGDKKGKAASLSNVAQVFLTRGDLDRALSLYEESLQLMEQIGDKKGKAASLSNMAQVFLTRGDLDRALSLYEESLQLKEQLGDKQGKGNSLSMLGNLYMMKKDYINAENAIIESLKIAKELGYKSDIAFNIVKLGQVAQARGDKETARSYYREGLLIFERMGMPEANQVRQMIASLEGSATSNDDPLAQFLAQARNSAKRKDILSAIQYQEQAVQVARELGRERDALVTLSVILYNLAGYYGNATRYEDAVRAMEEVVSIDQQTGHQDLESDRERLETFRRIASLSPEERAQLRQQTEEEQDSLDPDGEDGFEAQLAQLPPEQRAQAEVQIRRAYEEFQRMTPEQRAVFIDQGRRAEIEDAAEKARNAALAYVRRQAPRKDILAYLNDIAQKAAEGEDTGSPWLDVAALCYSLIALIKEEPIPPVPVVYASHFSAVQSELSKKEEL